MKYMIPEILQWQYMEGTSDTLASARLIIRLEPLSGNDHRGGMEDMAMYAELRSRLARHARRAALIGKETDEIPEAELPDPSLSVLVSTSKALSGRSWSNASSGYRSKSPSSVKPRRKTASFTPIKRLEMCSNFETPRRLTAVTEVTEGGGESSWSKPVTPHSGIATSIFSPCSHNRGVLRESFKRRMLMSPSKVKERARHHAMANLVTALNDVRAVFHRFKTTKRPLKDVLHAMRIHTKSKYTEEAAQLHLQLLLEYAPQFVCLDGDGDGKEILSINKECNLSAIKEMLKEMAEQRPKVEISDAVVEKRLSELDMFQQQQSQDRA